MKHPFISLISLFSKFFACLFIFVVAGCGNPNKADTETTSNGAIHISADESFKPVIDSQISVFVSDHPRANITEKYKPEADCFRDLFHDSATRMVIVTRGLSADEEQFFKDSMKYVPRQGKLAYDAVAVIVNNQARDSLFTLDDLSGILGGSDKKFRLRPVMDGTSATSTVRFAIDSILKGKPLGNNVTAAKSSEGVIEYVSQNVDAIGFIGVSWIGNKEDERQISFLQKVRIAAIKCKSCSSETYIKPYQANIAEMRYPMVRSLYYILKENFPGLGSGFVNFLQYERGQLIFKRAYLVPAKMSFEVRQVQL